MTHRITRLAFILLPIFVGSALLALIPRFNPLNVNTEQSATSPQIADPAFGSIQLSSDQVYRGDTLQYNVTVGAFGGFPLEMLNWSFSIQNLSLGGNPNVLTDWINITGTRVDSPTLNGSWTVPLESTSAGSYRVILWILNGSQVTYWFKNFTVLNNLPVINGISAIKYDYNRAETFNVTVNATDREIADLAPAAGTDENIYVHIYYRDTLGVIHTANAQNIGYNNYSTQITTIGATSPTGVYTFWAGIQDFRGDLMEPESEVTSNILLVTIRNQNPTLDMSSGVIVNDQNPVTTDISVRMGNTINITITASDPENSVRFILVKLKNFETSKWKNYTMNYQDSHTLIIDSNDLSVGAWALYITVIDQDGGSTEPPQHPTIEILEETGTLATQIIAFLIGIPVGLVIGAVLLSWRARRMARKNVGEKPADTEAASPVVEKARKISSRSEEEEETEVEEEKSETEEAEDESKTQMKRKIRRRIN